MVHNRNLFLGLRDHVSGWLCGTPILHMALSLGVGDELIFGLSFLDTVPVV